MEQEIIGTHFVDQNGKPAGGVTSARGIEITWQNGPLGREEERKEPNGAFVEGVIEAAIDRLKFYQMSDFACHENDLAIGLLSAALKALMIRTLRRIKSGTEGTHTPEPMMAVELTMHTENGKENEKGGV